MTRASGGRRPHDALPISTVSRMTGLSPDLIRAWEKRYGIASPVRGPRGARLYAAADVERLRLLQGAVQGGRRIRDVAHLSHSALVALEAPSPAPARAVPEGALPRVLDALRRYDADALDAELGETLVALGVRRFVGELVVPLLATVGAGWEAGHVAVADERLVSEALRALLAGLVRVRLRPGAPRIVLGTPSGERHEFGLLLVAILATEAGFRPYHLGVDVPARELVDAARRAEAGVVATSTVYRENHERAVTELRSLRRGLPAGTELWIGGRDAAAVGSSLGRGRVVVLDDLERTATELTRVRRSLAS